MGLPVWAPVKVYARVPFSRVTRDGMYDYATGKTVPPRFHNYVTGKDSTAEPSATINVREGDMSPRVGDDVCAVCAAGAGVAEDADRRVTSGWLRQARTTWDTHGMGLA